MTHHVCFQIIVPCRLFLRVITTIRFLHGVTHYVCFQMTVLWQCFFTVITNKGFIFIVCLHVNFQINIKRKWFVTHFTIVGFPYTVCLQMLFLWYSVIFSWCISALGATLGFCPFTVAFSSALSFSVSVWVLAGSIALFLLGFYCSFMLRHIDQCGRVYSFLRQCLCGPNQYVSFMAVLFLHIVIRGCLCALFSG